MGCFHDLSLSLSLVEPHTQHTRARPFGTEPPACRVFSAAAVKFSAPEPRRCRAAPVAEDVICSVFVERIGHGA